MKRRFLAIFAVLLVLLLATCDNSEGTGDDQAIPEGMARLTIKVDDGSGAGKALISAAGSTAADYYEVVFHMGGTYYQAEWAKLDGPGSIIVPEGTYANADAAVMFAGKNNSSEKNPSGGRRYNFSFRRCNSIGSRQCYIYGIFADKRCKYR